jgi:transcription antitermination factor NusG
MSSPSTSDTNIGISTSDTRCVGLVTGQRVRIVGGPLMGASARVIERRPQGRMLVQIHHGVLVELAEYVLEKADKV